MDPKEKKVKEEELNVEETHNPAEDQPQNEQAEGTAPLTHEEELEKELEKAQEALEEQKDKYLRLSAEFDNYRKRTLKEKAELILNGGEKSLGSILPVVDDFERAIKTMETATDVNAVKEGVELIYNKFMAVLAQNGVIFRLPATMRYLLLFANATVGKNVQRFLLNVSPMNVLPEPENVSLKWT